MEKLFDLFYQTSGICTDTRQISKDCLFICLKGENFNGNMFAEQALKNGAKYVIADEIHFETNENIHLVENALVYLQKLANYHRSKFNIPIIGITGSNGKTSTKELINCVLSDKYNVLATRGNLNNHIGVPLTLLGLTKQHEIAIIEMGANRFKDIEELCTIANPTHGIITNIGKAHLEGFKDFEGVLNTKKELYNAIPKKNGVVVFNEDDAVLRENVPKDVRLVSYGTDRNCFVNGNLIGLSPFVEMSWTHNEYSSRPIHTKMIGKYNFYNYLAAIAFGVLFDVPFENINRAIEGYTPDNNRSQVKKTTNNTLILDCYNANPSSMLSALESFSMIEHKDKLFIIGDMLELGDETKKEHQQIAGQVKKLDLKGFTVGPIFKTIQSSAFQMQFKTKMEAMEFFSQNQLKNHLILLKGSRGIGLESLEEYL